MPLERYSHQKKHSEVIVSTEGSDIMNKVESVKLEQKVIIRDN